MVMNKIIVLFETVKCDGSRKYDFEEFSYDPDVKTCKELSSELERERKQRLTANPQIDKEVNVVNFQIV